MKHHLFLFAITVLSFTACRSSFTDWDRFELSKGGVQSFSEARYEAFLNDDGSWEQGDPQGLARKSEFLFNETGTYIKSHWYRDSELGEVTIPQYVDGKMIGSITENAEGEKTGESKLIEENKGYRILEAYSPSGELESRIQQRYKGALLLHSQTTHFKPDGEIQFEMETAYSHNRDGTLHTISNIIDGERNVSYELEYLEYDDQGNWIRRVAFDNTGNPDNYGVGVMSVREIVYFSDL